jgi:hypothetical protein
MEQQYVNCPRCDGDQIVKVAWTFWGGALGPALFCHVKCRDCGLTYNGKTGQSNTGPIIIYSVVAALLGIVVMFALIFGLKYM